MPRIVPFIEVGHKYQPPSVIVGRATQTAFVLTSALFPTVTVYFVHLEGTSSLLRKRIDLIETDYLNVTFQNPTSVDECTSFNFSIASNAGGFPVLIIIIVPSHPVTAV
jgi:hypothetical protein